MVDDHSLPHRIRRASAHYFVDPLVCFLVRLRVRPMVITVMGLLTGIGGGAFVAVGWFQAAVGLILLSSLMDLLDGAVARKREMTSLMGAVMDSIFDRFQEGAVFIGLAVFFIYFSGGNYWLGSAAPDTLGTMLTFTAFFGSVMISYLRARAEGYGVTGTSGLVTRPERIIIIVVCLVVNQPLALVIIMSAATAVGIMLRGFSIIRRIHRGESERAND